MRAVVQAGPGGPEVLSLGEVPAPASAPGAVRIAVAAAGLNRADLLQRAGHYPPPPGASELLGLEVSGRILEGAGEFTPGQEVLALLAGGGYAEQVVVDARHVLPLPPGLDGVRAGGLIEVFLTAYLNLSALGGLQAGERVLIHGGAGGVGTAAIQWARAQGAEVWTTARASALERCRELGATRALDYAATDFAQELGAVGGADLILDCLGAKYLDPNLRALREDGRLIVIGLQGGRRAELDLGALLVGRKRILGSTLRALSAERKAALITAFRAEVWPRFASGELEVVLERSYPWTEVAQAHRDLAQGGGVGKRVLVL